MKLAAAGIGMDRSASGAQDQISNLFRGVFICQTIAELRCRNNQLSLLAFGASGFPIRADKGADEYDDVRGNHCKQRPKKDGVTHNFPSPL